MLRTNMCGTNRPMRHRHSEAMHASTQRRPCEAPAPPRSPLDPIAPSRRPLGVALSGGGIRAALTGLGTLRLLSDVGRLSDVRHLTSVSGGSIVAGLVACRWGELREAGFRRDVFDRLITHPIITTVTGRSLQHDLLRRLWRTLSPGNSRTDLLADLLARTLLGGWSAIGVCCACAVV